MKIVIAVPTYESIYPDTFKAIWDLKKPEGAEVDFIYVRGYDCARARNNIVNECKKLKADYVLMIDNDTVPPKDALVNLLEDDKDVVVGYYAHRVFNQKYDGRTNACKLGEFNYTKQYTGAELHELRDAGHNVMQIHGGGLGCALIKMSLFDRLQFPWFDWKNYPNNYVLSEDLFFAENLRTNAQAIYVDTRVECGHIFRTVQNCNPTK